MKPEHIQVLENVCYQCGDVRNIDELATVLLQSATITKLDFDRVKNEQSQLRKSKVLFNDVLPPKSNEVMTKLISALEQIGLEEHASFIRSSLGFVEKNKSILPSMALPKLWNLPPKNRYFTGRVEYLKKLALLLKPNDSEQEHLVSSKFEQTTTMGTVISACEGLGGVGKTQLAIQFAYMNREAYKHIFWFPAETSTEIEAAYQQLAFDLKIDVKKPQEMIREIKLWFHRHPGSLLIYDNAPDYEAIKAYLPSLSTNNYIVVTSRTTNWHWFGESLSIDVFTAEEARLFFQKLLGTLYEMSNADKLAATLGYLPLALAQAGAYIKEKGIPITQYLALYEKEKEKLLEDKTLPTSIHIPVLVTWDITMEAIQKESLLATHMLRVCAYVHNENIPDFLLQALAANPEYTSEIFEAARGVLDNYSMIKVNPDKAIVSLHQLVQEVVQLKEQKPSTPLLQALKLVLKTFPDADSLEDYQKKSILVPHMEAILHHLDKGLTENMAVNKLLTLTILIQLAEGYSVLGNIQKERTMLERTLNIQEQHYSPNHPTVATTLINLGNVYGSLGDYTKQSELLQRSLKILELYYGPDHPQVAVTLTNLGIAYGNLGDYTKKRELLERSLKIKEQHYGPDHSSVTITLTNLGNAYGSLGDYTKQRDLLERSLKTEEQHYGPNHPQVAITLVGLGNAYCSLGDYTKQRNLLERAMRIQEQHYGPDHPEVAVTLTNLGTAYGSLGDYTKQRELLERSLKIKEQHYGSDQPSVAITLTNLGNAYGNLGDYTKQRDLQERSLKIEEQHYGPGHPQVAITLTSLGNAYCSLGDYTKQRDLLERSMKIQEQHYGPNHPDVAIILTNLGAAYGRLGNSIKGHDLLERALKIQEQYYGCDHSIVAITLTNLGTAHGRLRDYTKQRDLQERSLKILEHHYGPDHLELLITLTTLGNAYGSLGDYTKQRELLERSLKIKEQHYGPNHPSMASTLMNLGNVYENLGDYVKQHEMLEQALRTKGLYVGSHLSVIAKVLKKFGLIRGNAWESSPFNRAIHEHECIRVGICDMMEQKSEGLDTLPDTLHNLVQTLFSFFYQHLADTCSKLISMGLQDKPMIDKFGNKCGIFNPFGLLKRLEVLHQLFPRDASMLCLILPVVNTKMCTFIVTGKEHAEQTWFQCLTCGMDPDEGVCVFCKTACHKNHELGPSRYSAFVCDCRLQKNNSCKALEQQNYD